MIRLVVCGVALLLAMTGAGLADTPETACDRLSGMPIEQDWLDFDRPGPVYSQGRTKDEVESVVFACKAASDQFPDEKRFAFRHGLALKDLGRTDEALAAFERARRLGSVGGYDEAGSILLFGSSDEPGWKAADPKAAAALLDEGVARFGPGPGSQMLRSIRAYGRRWDPDPAEAARGEADLKALAEEGGVWALVTLARSWLGKSPELDKAAVANFLKAVDLGSGVAAVRLGDTLRNKDDAEMIRLYRLGVARGSADAMNALGYCYEYGIGVPRVGSIAIDYYLMAAKRGHVVAQGNLGGLYAAGELFAPDYDKARRWLEIATENGSRNAPMSLGMLYDWGRGVPVDLARARSLYEIGAARGHVGAMNNMGYLFEHGRGAEVDLAKAREWYEKAADAGDADAANNLAEMYRSGHGVAKDAAKAFALSMKSAENKNAKGVNNLAIAYMRGEGVAKDLETARALLTEAEALGSIEAAHNLASMIESGQGGDSDSAEARRLFKKAAQAGFPNSMYRYGNRVRLDADFDDEGAYRAAMIEARNWLKRAVEAGDPYGVETLAEMIADGDGGPSDPTEALRLFRIAASSDVAAKIALAGRLRSGEGVPADPAEARRLLGETRTVEGVGAYIAMLDAGEGGAKDPLAGTELLRGRVAAGHFEFVGLLARRLVDGVGARPDPAGARGILGRAIKKWPLPEASLMLGRMREEGHGGPVDTIGAVEAYRAAGAEPEAMVRLASMLRAGRGAGVDKAAARKLLEQAGFAAGGIGVLALIEMLDRGEGGPPDPGQAAIVLRTALVVQRDPRAVELVANPGKRLGRATREAFLKLMEMQGHERPNGAETSGPLLDRQALALYSAKPGETEPEPRRTIDPPRL